MIIAAIILLIFAALTALAIAWWHTTSLVEIIGETKPIAIPEAKPPEFDWFVWESEQIQRCGYVFWFDHWRYEGQPGAYPDPTPEQRRKVFEMSKAKALEHMSEERLDHCVSKAIDRLTQSGFSERAAFERVMQMGQDPVRWAIDQAR